MAALDRENAAIGEWLQQRVDEAFAGRQRNIPAREDVDTVAVFANPEHPQRKAIEITPAGYVLVIDCRGDTRAACAGQILVTRLMKRGVAGLVGDGGIRDAGPIGEMPQFPVFCAGASAPLNLAQHHAVETNVPIGCGGVAVYPGDIIVGDGDPAEHRQMLQQLGMVAK